jgi:hypothetical protein
MPHETHQPIAGRPLVWKSKLDTSARVPKLILARQIRFVSALTGVLDTFKIALVSASDEATDV